MSSSPFRYVPGCTVEYRGPTEKRGSVWAAVIRRGLGRADVYRASVSFKEGPDAAARAVVDRINQALDFEWVVLGAALSMNGNDRYAYPVGPADLAPVLSMPAPARPEV